VLIHLDVAKALQDGIKLYQSENKVILTEGHNGIIKPQFFSHVEILSVLPPIE
jgi:RNA:NAD 2'-phosphotransferase (TPT1/KptA family)